MEHEDRLAVSRLLLGVFGIKSLDCCSFASVSRRISFLWWGSKSSRASC
jgi:hypothetical protein